MKFLCANICLLVALSMFRECLAHQNARPIPSIPSIASLTSEPETNSIEGETQDEAHLGSTELQYLDRVQRLSSKVDAHPKCWHRYHDPNCLPYDADVDWKDKCYCDLHVHDGPSEVNFCCNFYGYAANLANHLLPFRRISLTNSSLLDLAVHALTAESIQINNANINRIIARGSPRTYPMRLDASSLAVSSLSTFTWLHLYNSHVDEITANMNATEIVIKKSSVGLILDINVSKLYQKSVKNATFFLEGAVVGHMSNITVEGTTVLKNSYITSISNCTFQNLRIAGSTTINSVYPNGLYFDEIPGYVNETLFRHLHRGAVTVPKLESLSNLKNVSIMHCDIPCFKLTDGREIHFEQEHNHNRTYNTFYLLELPVVATEIDTGRGQCKEEGNSVECDEPMIEGSELILQNEEAPGYITMSHRENVTILDGNNFSVRLFNVSGSYLDYKTYEDDFEMPGSSFTATKSRSLNVRQCTLTTLFSKNFNEVVFDEAQTIVQYLDLGEVEHFWSNWLKLNYLEELIFKKLTSTDEFHFTRGSIQNIQHLVLHSMATIDFSTFGKVTSLIIDHEEDYKKRSIIRNCIVNYVTPKGIRIERGYVDLDSVTFKKLKPNMIFMSGTSKLFFRRMKDRSFNCSSTSGSVKAISVQRRSQVVYEGKPAPKWLMDCLKIRPMQFQQKPLENYRILEPSDCTSGNNLQHLSCLFTNKIQSSQLIQLGYHAGLDKYSSVYLSGVKNLVIGENCFAEIQLSNSYCSLIEAADDSCFVNLKLQDSRLETIPGNIWKIFMINSFASLLSPSSSVESASVESSKINGISLAGSVLHFKSVEFDDIQRLIVTEKLFMDNCTIDRIGTYNVHIEWHAEAIIQNTTIRILGIGAIALKGSLVMVNVTIEKGSLSDIVEHTNSRLVLRNTKFIEDEISEPKDLNPSTEKRTTQSTYDFDEVLHTSMVPGTLEQEFVKEESLSEFGSHNKEISGISDDNYDHDEDSNTDASFNFQDVENIFIIIISFLLLLLLVLLGFVIKAGVTSCKGRMKKKDEVESRGLENVRVEQPVRNSAFFNALYPENYGNDRGGPAPSQAMERSNNVTIQAELHNPEEFPMEQTRRRPAASSVVTAESSPRFQPRRLAKERSGYASNSAVSPRNSNLLAAASGSYVALNSSFETDSVINV